MRGHHRVRSRIHSITLRRFALGCFLGGRIGCALRWFVVAGRRLTLPESGNDLLRYVGTLVHDLHGLLVNTGACEAGSKPFKRLVGGDREFVKIGSH